MKAPSLTLGIEEEYQISMELDSTEMMKRFVQAGMGLTFLATSHFKEDLDAGCVGEGLVRISVGIEDWRDLLRDFENALSGE